MDTVHPVGTLNVLPWRQDGAKCYGPGIVDMKGGNYLALEAIRQLMRAGVATPLPVTVLFTSDEEVGSPSTRDLIEAEAARHRYVLVPEPCRQNGSVVSGRYAIARFNLESVGRPSHAGARLADGRSAIRAMARRIIEIEQMTTDDCTFSVGVVAGGQWVNCVATVCRGEALSMAKRQQDLDQGVERMLGAVGYGRRRRLHGDARRDPAGMGAGRDRSSRCSTPHDPSRKVSASTSATRARAAARTATSPARWASRRSTDSAHAARALTRCRSISRSTA